MTTERQVAEEVEAARRAARVDCIPTERQMEEETAAFDVVVGGMGVIGRWSQLGPDRGVVTWTDGSHATTGGCCEDEAPGKSSSPDPEKIADAVRASIPIRTEHEDRAESKAFLRRLPGLR